MKSLHIKCVYSLLNGNVYYTPLAQTRLELFSPCNQQAIMFARHLYTRNGTDGDAAYLQLHQGTGCRSISIQKRLYQSHSSIRSTCKRFIYSLLSYTALLSDVFPTTTLTFAA